MSKLAAIRRWEVLWPQGSVTKQLDYYAASSIQEKCKDYQIVDFCIFLPLEIFFEVENCQNQTFGGVFGVFVFYKDTLVIAIFLRVKKYLEILQAEYQRYKPRQKLPELHLLLFKARREDEMKTGRQNKRAKDN